MQRRDFLSCCTAGSPGLYPALALAAQVDGAEVLPLRRTHFESKAQSAGRCRFIGCKVGPVHESRQRDGSDLAI